MRRSTVLLVCAAAALAAGCSKSRRGAPRDGGIVRIDSGLDGVDAFVPPTGGETRTWVLSVLDVGQADAAGDPDVVPGFDLDGRVSDETDPQGCFKPDFVSPPPDREDGVDNQLGPILASLGGSFDVSGAIADAIAGGDLLVLVEVRNLNDPVDDASVEIELFMADPPAGGLALDASGRLAPGQTFPTRESLGSVDGMVVNRRLSAGPSGSIRFPLFFDASLGLIRHDAARLRMNIGGTGIDTGVLGGGLDIETVITAIVAAVMDVPEMLARSILEGQADLAPDATGQCRQISVGWIFEGVPATRH